MPCPSDQAPECLFKTFDENTGCVTDATLALVDSHDRQWLGTLD